jgi:hypothetical protein
MLRRALGADGAVYVMSQDNRDLFAQGDRWLNQLVNAPRWKSPACRRRRSVDQPGHGRRGSSSGELNAYRYENGRQVWQDALARTRSLPAWPH